MTLISTNWYNVFYWLTRADSVKDLFDTTSNLFSWFTVIFFILIVVFSFGLASAISENRTKNEKEDQDNPEIRAWKRARKLSAYIFYPLLFLSLITWFGYVFTPTKKEALLIVAGGGAMNYLTTDSSAKQIPHELSTFVLTELKTMAKDAEVDLGIATQKDKILDEAKTMTTVQLLDRMKVDTNFAKIVLNK